MKISHMILIVMAVTLVAAMPAKSYADPQLDTLVNIATQAKDNLGATISQMSSVPNDISQLYGQGSNETDALTQAAAQQDVGAAKEHFLAAMRFFKETNDKINSLGTASAPTDRQRAQTEDLRGEVVRLENVGRLLKTIAAQNSVPVNFTGFDQMIQAASQDLDSGNLTDASKQVSSANDFIAATHNALNKAAQDRISERAKDFTERQIEQMNQTQTGPAQQNGQQGQGSTGQNPAAQNATAPVQPPGPPQTASPNLPPGGNSNITMSKNPQEMVAQLKKLVAEGKVDQAIALIKMIQAYQHEQLAQKAAELSAEHENSPSQPPQAPGLVQNSTAPPVQNIPPVQNHNPAPPVPPLNNQAPQQNGTLPPPQQNSTAPPVPNIPHVQTHNPAPPVPPLNNQAPQQNGTLPPPPQNSTVPPAPPAQNATAPPQNNTIPTPPPLPTPPTIPPASQNGTAQSPPPQPNPPAQNNATTTSPQRDHLNNQKEHYRGNPHNQENGNSAYRGNDNQGNGYSFPWIQRQDHRRG